MKRQIVILIAGAGISSLAAIQSFASALADKDVVIVTSNTESPDLSVIATELIPRNPIFSAIVDIDPVDVSGFGDFPKMGFSGSHYEYVVIVEPRCRSPGDNADKLAFNKLPEPKLA